MSIVPQPLYSIRCCRCGIDKPLSDFSKCRSRKTGYSARCRSCDMEAKQTWLNNMSDEAKTAYYEHRRASWHKGAASNPEHTRARRRKSYYKTNAKVKTSEWAKRNRDKVNATKRKTYQNDPTNSRACANRRRSLERSMAGRHTHKEWLALLEMYGYRCARCYSPNNLQLDHIVPVSKGGTDFISNIVPLCIKCNGWKQDRHINYRFDRLLPAPGMT